MSKSVQGLFHNGAAHPLQPVAGREGQRVIITFVEETSPSSPPALPDRNGDEEPDEWDQLIDSCSVDTGIADFAEEHDHYIHGTPKKKRRRK
jgi:hypothetical protein